jgi:purine-nucleoside phosphorylase
MHDDSILFEQVQKSAQYLLGQIEQKPSIGLVTGTGLSDILDDVDVIKSIPYEDIPHFPISTVKTHTGKLVFAKQGGKRLVILQGRFHYYEGYSMQKLTLPIRVLAELGIQSLVLTNIAGGLNPVYQLSDLVVVKDHINLMPENPLRGLNDDRFGPRFPVMLDAYDKSMRQKLIQIAAKNNIVIHEGIYLSLQGPSLETRAEYAYLKMIGADLVGMSTVPEVIVATQIGLKTCVISCVSNLANDPDDIKHEDLETLLQVARQAGFKLRVILKELILEL